MNKIDTFIDAYSIVLGLNDKITNIIKELGNNWIQYYSKIKPCISIEEDDDELFIIKSQNGNYSIENYFLNKLMRNILHFRYDYSSADTFMASKGGFSPSEHCVEINEELINDSINTVKETITKKTDKNPTEYLVNIIYKKVIMHEFEHGLKVSYNNGRLNEDDIKVIEAISYRLSQTEYSNMCKKPDELNTINNNRNMPEKWLHNGMDHRNKIYAISFLDEVNNENESLIMANSPIQYNDGIPDMYYINKNSESSSSFYSSTVEMFNIIFGRKNSFEMAYLNKNNLVDLFNSKYDKIFQQEFLSNDHAINIFCSKLNECKSLNDKLKLEEVLLKCFYSEIEIRCDYDLDTMLEDWNTIKGITLQFSDEIMSKLKNSPKTDFFRVYDEINQRLFLERINKFNNSETVSSRKK